MRVVASWREPNGLIIQAREDGALRAVVFAPEGPTLWTVPETVEAPVEAPVVADQAERRTGHWANGGYEEWWCKCPPLRFKPFADLHSHTVMRCEKCHTARPA